MELVRTAAAGGATAPPTTTVYRRAVIMVFLDGAVDIDADNVAKPILDALKGIAMGDDSQIEELVVRKVIRSSDQVFDNASPALAAALASHRQFVYVRLDMAFEPRAIP